MGIVCAETRGQDLSRASVLVGAGVDGKVRDEELIARMASKRNRFCA